jgi:hypothetical protein
MGSCGMVGVVVGRGGVGEGGADCWYVVLVLYVVQLKRLVDPFSLPIVDAGVALREFDATLALSGVERPGVVLPVPAA